MSPDKHDSRAGGVYKGAIAEHALGRGMPGKPTMVLPHFPGGRGIPPGAVPVHGGGLLLKGPPNPSFPGLETELLRSKGLFYQPGVPDHHLMKGYLMHGGAPPPPGALSKGGPAAAAASAGAAAGAAAAAGNAATPGASSSATNNPYPTGGTLTPGRRGGDPHQHAGAPGSSRWGNNYNSNSYGKGEGGITYYGKGGGGGGAPDPWSSPGSYERAA